MQPTLRDLCEPAIQAFVRTSFLSQTFSDGDINSYFFETPPVTHETKRETKFEFVLVSAKELNDATADPRLGSAVLKLDSKKAT